MAKKVSRRMVALSMASIAAVYFAGYTLTEPAAQHIAQAEDSVPTVSVPPTTSPVPVIASPVPTPSSWSVPSSVPSVLLPKSAATPTLPPTTALPIEATSTAVPRTATAVKVATPVATPKPASTGLKDGAYSATGVSRRGDVTVAVTIQSGRIAAVDITQCMTQYPQSFIDGLPAQVVARQSAQVNLVSGATYSSRAFQSAVSQALAQARSSATATG